MIDYEKALKDFFVEIEDCLDECLRDASRSTYLAYLEGLFDASTLFLKSFVSVSNIEEIFRKNNMKEYAKHKWDCKGDRSWYFVGFVYMEQWLEIIKETPPLSQVSFAIKIKSWAYSRAQSMGLDDSTMRKKIFEEIGLIGTALLVAGMAHKGRNIPISDEEARLINNLNALNDFDIK